MKLLPYMKGRGYKIRGTNNKRWLQQTEETQWDTKLT
jgi:hypothetical protein